MEKAIAVKAKEKIFSMSDAYFPLAFITTANNNDC